jgi:azurin
MLQRVIFFLSLLSATSLALADKTCPVTIEGNDQMQYSLTEIKVPADCTVVEVTLKHAGTLPVQAMGHDWVLAKTSDYVAIASAGAAAGLANDYLPPGDKRVIAHTKNIGGGQSTTVQFPTSKLTKGGDYTFFCSFPGHYPLMHGKFIY